MNRHQAMIDYIRLSPLLTDNLLYFDTVTNEDGTVSVAAIQSNEFLEDILGNRSGRYDFAVILMRNISTGTDGTNVDNMDVLDRWRDWIDEQDLDKNFPDFGERIEVESIRNLNNMGNFAQAYDNGVGKYMIMCRVNYIERKNV